MIVVWILLTVVGFWGLGFGPLWVFAALSGSSPWQQRAQKPLMDVTLVFFGALMIASYWQAVSH